MCVYHYDYDRRKKVITVSGFLSSSLNSFNTKFGIEFGPVAFLALGETIILLISFSLQGLGEMKLSIDFLNNLNVSFFYFGVPSLSSYNFCNSTKVFVKCLAIFLQIC